MDGRRTTPPLHVTLSFLPVSLEMSAPLEQGHDVFHPEAQAKIKDMYTRTAFLLEESVIPASRPRRHRDLSSLVM